MFGGVIALAAAASGPARAQDVPGRDLMEFPVGTVAEAPVLATISGHGLWNPATILLRDGSRVRVTAAALEGPAEQGVTAQLISAAYALRERTTVAITLARASVEDLIRTVDDPQTVDGEIPYSTIILSAAVARRTHRYLSAGAALRYRQGQIDNRSGSAVGIDAGILVDGFSWRDARMAASTFLWRPAADAESELTRLSAGGDLRVVGDDSLREARAGYAAAFTERMASEHYFFASGRWRPVHARGGVAYMSAYGNDEWRFRLGVGLHHARYIVGVAREDSGAGLGATYAFTLTTTIW
jgi:hypothetical protein